MDEEALKALPLRWLEVGGTLTREPQDVLQLIVLLLGQFASQPNYASKDQQDYVAYTYWQRAGWGPWSCG